MEMTVHSSCSPPLPSSFPGAPAAVIYLFNKVSKFFTDLVSNISSIATCHLPVTLSLSRNPVDTHLYE